MPDPLPDPIDPALVRRLGRLVTGLTLVMIIGVISVVVLMAIRLNRVDPLPLPGNIALPGGAKADAVTVTADRLLVVSGQSLFVFARDDGRLLQTISLP